MSDDSATRHEIIRQAVVVSASRPRNSVVLAICDHDASPEAVQEAIAGSPLHIPAEGVPELLRSMGEALEYLRGDGGEPPVLVA